MAGRTDKFKYDTRAKVAEQGRSVGCVCMCIVGEREGGRVGKEREGRGGKGKEGGVSC